MVTIYVGNLNFRSTTEEVEELFGKYGAVSSCKIIIDRETGRSKGFGFVEMEQDEANSAIEALNGIEFNGRNIRVHEAKERTERERPSFQQRDGGFNRDNRRSQSQNAW